MTIALTLHLLSAVIWVGGMFFAYLCLRPAAAALQKPDRLSLWVGVLGRFFLWAGISVVVLLVTGFWMIHHMGGMAVMSPYVHAMLGLGILMMLLYGHVAAAPFGRLRRAVAGGDLEVAGRALGQIRVLVAINLALGLIVIVIAAFIQAPPVF